LEDFAERGDHLVVGLGAGLVRRPLQQERGLREGVDDVTGQLELLPCPREVAHGRLDQLRLLLRRLLRGDRRGLPRALGGRGHRGGRLRGAGGARERLRAVVLVLDDVEDLLGGRRGAAPGCGAAARPRGARRGGRLLLHPLLEGLVPHVAEALVVALGGLRLGLLLPGEAPRTAGGLRLGGLYVDGGIRAARAQPEGDGLLILLLAAPHHHLVHTTQARGYGLDRGGGEHQDAEGDQHRLEDDHGERGYERLERRGGEVAEDAAAAGQGIDAVGRGGQARGDRGDGGQRREQERDADRDAGVGPHLVR